MGWIVREKRTKGSLIWIQHVVNERPDALNIEDSGVRPTQLTKQEKEDIRKQVKNLIRA